MARLYIGGPSCCGKTSVIDKINNLYPHISCLSGSQIMMRAAGVLSREELSLLPEDKKDFLRETAFSSYYTAARNLILEGHFFLTEIDAKFLNSFVYIETDVKSLIRFRKLDKTRARSVTRNDILQEVSDLDGRVKEFESQYGIKVIHVLNDSILDKLVSRILTLYSNISGAMY